MTEKEKESTAWHEAGHALVNVLLEHTDPLHKVTIIPRGSALGVTMSLPAGDPLSFGRKEALDKMAMIAAAASPRNFIRTISRPARPWTSSR